VYTKENGFPVKFYNKKLPAAGEEEEEEPNQRPSHQTFLWAGQGSQAKQLWKTCRGLLGSFSAFCLLVACLFCRVQCRAMIRVPSTDTPMDKKACDDDLSGHVSMQVLF
jgi:hypothetical protein